MDYNMQKKCGFCGETIPRSASRCPYCGSILEVTVDDSFSVAEPQQDTGENNTVMPQPEDKHEAALSGQSPDEGRESEAGNDDAYRQQNEGWQAGPYNQGTQRPYYPRNQQPTPSNGGKTPLSNGLKVFLTVLFTVLPGIGQLAGIITAIVFMSSDGDSDRKSFGVALLVASLAMFVLSCVSCFVLSLLGQSLSYY